MNIIAIYHHPQECGSPYLAIVNQQSGEIVEKISIPEGYYYSGMKRRETLTKVYEFTEQICTTKVPTPEEYMVKAQYGFPGRKYKYRVTKVEITGEDDSVMHTYDCTVHIDACDVKEEYLYFQEEDAFRQGMEEQGFDMSAWPATVREKTDYDVFLRTVVNTWNQDYHLVNLIHIG